MPDGSTRRNFIQVGAVLAGTPSLKGAPKGSSAVYARLGVTPVINGIGTVTILGGSVMPPEVVAAMEEASRSYVRLPELQEKAGAHIASLLNVPAAMVTAGAASAITVAAAACLASGDVKNLYKLPDIAGLKHEIVQQKSHRSGYEAQMLLTGARIVWVETAQEMERAINDRTAMAFFLNKNEPDGQIKRDEFIRIARARGVPSFNDAAADVPPPSRLTEYVQQGFDLVAFSGGKGLFGPQCSGLLLGRKDLIDIGLRAISPHGGIGRGMKVGKEEIVGLVAAVERYLKVDQAAERKVLDQRAAHVMKTLSGLTGVRCEIDVPEFANHVPHVVVRWDEAARKLTAKQVVDRLGEGEPPIMVSHGGPGGLRISMWTLRGKEHEILGRRVREELERV